MGLFGPVKYAQQDYKALKQRCKQTKRLFVDDRFPPESASLFRRETPGGVSPSRIKVPNQSINQSIIKRDKRKKKKKKKKKNKKCTPGGSA